MAGREDDRVLGAHPVGDLGLELEVQRRRAVEQARAGEAGAVALESVHGALLDALVGGQAQVVVGAEHHALGALHLDHRHGRRLDQAEVGEQVLLARGAKQLGAVVVACFGEDVDAGGHIRCAAVSVEIRRVESKGDRKLFLDLPYRLYATEKRWVPPLRLERKEHIDPKKNPFFEHAEVQFFLAWRDGRPVGRISAHIDHNLNAFQDNRWGLFGFFECEDDPEAARALIDTAEAWLRERGRDRMVGPMDYTTNDECGLLIEGHERPPIILCPWQHPYYQRLLEETCGLGKAMDLQMWELHIEGKENVHPAI